MVRLTRGERFKDARTVHNQHMKQTMDEVAAATGISKSLIQALEDDENNRSVGYDKVATLAAHYHVSTDYLLGLSDDPSLSPAATDDLHLSEKAIKQMKYFTCTEQHAAELSALMEDRLFWSMLREIIAYQKASIAEGISDSIKLKYHTYEEDSCIDETLNEEKIETEITAIINDDTLDKTTRNYLSSLRYLDSLSGLSELHPDAAYVLNFVPSEIIEQRARNYFQDILVKMNPENPIHELRRIYLEAAKAGHIGYDLNGNGHYCRKRKGGE